MNAVLPAQRETPPSFLKSATLAATTVALAMWGLGTLWLHAEQSAPMATAAAQLDGTGAH